MTDMHIPIALCYNNFFLGLHCCCSICTGLATHLTRFGTSRDTTGIQMNGISCWMMGQQSVCNESKTKSCLWFVVLLMDIWPDCSLEEKFSLQVQRSITVNVSLKIKCSCEDQTFYTKVMVGKGTWTYGHIYVSVVPPYKRKWHIAGKWPD